MACTQNRFSLLQNDADSDSVSDECECDSWVIEKDDALRAYFKKQTIPAEWCPGCAHLFYSKMYDFVFGSRVLMTADMFAKIMEAYKAILSAYATMKPKDVYFSKEFYEFVYKKVTDIVMARKGRLMGGFHHYFASMYGELMDTLNYCGGYNPPKMIGHQNFSKCK